MRSEAKSVFLYPPNASRLLPHDLSFMQAIIDQLADAIRAAALSQTPLCIRGGGSKDFYGGELRGEILEVNAYRGIIDYEPTELVITARCGTPLADAVITGSFWRVSARAVGPSCRPIA